MTCARFWSVGVLLIEQGVHDEHRTTCLDCQRQYRVHVALVGALALLGSERQPPADWQARVWHAVSKYD